VGRPREELHEHEHGHGGGAEGHPGGERALCEPARQRPAAGLDPADPPDTRSILEQAGAEAYDAPGLHGPRLTRPLGLGRDVVVQTAGLSRLLVDTA
jgi:hypothetical protein